MYQAENLLKASDDSTSFPEKEPIRPTRILRHYSFALARARYYDSDRLEHASPEWTQQDGPSECIHRQNSSTHSRGDLRRPRPYCNSLEPISSIGSPGTLAYTNQEWKSFSPKWGWSLDPLLQEEDASSISPHAPDASALPSSWATGCCCSSRKPASQSLYSSSWMKLRTTRRELACASW